MKKVVKILIIIAMILEALAIVPLIFGFISLGKIKNATCKADVAPLWAILTLIFVNPIPGILMFFLKDEDFAA